MNKISIYHIGGRNGANGSPYPAKFDPDLSHIFFDADSSCIEHIKEIHKNFKSEIQVFPYCLSDSCKVASLNINYDPYTSSLYKMNPEYNSYCTFLSGCDYIISDVTKTIETRQVETESIDHLLKDGKLPAPDFISIDTQGSEHDVLKGAQETLRSSVVGIMVESTFHPISESGIVFGDLAKFLSDNGFYFVRFFNVDEASPYRGSIGLRGQGFQMSADCLFLRKIDTITDELMLWKLAFIAIIFNQIEYAIASLRKGKGIPKNENEPIYTRFLREVMIGIQKMQEVFPNTFYDFYPTFEDSNARFSVGQAPKTVQLKKRQLHESIAVQGFTELEQALLRYGLESQANLIRKNRVVQMRSVAL